MTEHQAKLVLVRFGRRVKELRVERALSQEEVARRVGMASEHLCRTENGWGERGPALVRIHEIARALGVTASDLVGE